MRPEILFPLFASLTSIKGVGPRGAALYKKLCGEYVVDLLWHLPTGVIDRTYSPNLNRAEKNRVATITLTITEHAPPPSINKKLPYRIMAIDAGETPITLNYFNVTGDYLGRLYPVGKKLVVSGLLELYRGGWAMNHPDYALPIEARESIPKFEPIYPLTHGVSGKILRKIISAGLERAPKMPEWISSDLIQREDWIGWHDAITLAHNPTNMAWGQENTIESRARQRLAYDELLADQLALAVIRRHHRTRKGRAFIGTGKLQTPLTQSLPFTLTSGQHQAIAEIAQDMESPTRMLRLLQGDVGSGKTIVALISMLRAIEAGAAAALMVPTEILARQHHAKINALLAPLNITAHILTGRMHNKEKQKIMDGMKDGTMPIIIGTHALFQEDVAFQNLGLIVVDEQHRFGVEQRLQLADKGNHVDILVMSATPIPRTLTLTAYGDMDVSRLMDKPIGRQMIDTRLIDSARIEEVVAGLQRQIAKGTQAYWVCPLVMESEKLDLANATERAKTLKKILGDDKVGLVHGQMPSAEKDKVMAGFVAGDIKVLVATTVIEVGVDVAAASLMIIEHSERFGLSQLHQLRGRVGRGDDKSTCLLMYQTPLGAMAKSRLTMMRETNDGFKIAEEDLRLRGGGEILGTKQSGLPTHRLADLMRDQALLQIAHRDAELILDRDPELKSERGMALRILLYLFGRDGAVPLLRAG